MAFTPVSTAVNLANVNATASVALGVASDNLGSYSVRVINASDLTLFINFGTSTVTAIADTSIAIRAGAPPEILTIGRGITHVAAVAGAASTGKIYFHLGQGE